MGAKEEQLLEELTYLRQKVEHMSQKENKLLASESLFRATFDQVAVGIVHGDLDGNWIRVNKKFCDIVGYTNDELINKHFSDITHPDDIETDLNYVKRLLAGDIYTFSMEKRYIKKDGTYIWINLTVSLAYVESTGLNYFIGVIEDIDDRKRAEAALRESEERHRQLIENAPIGIITCDTNGQLTAINRQALDILNSPDAEITIDYNAFTFPLTMEAGISANILKCIETGETIIREQLYTSKWDKTVYLRIHMTPLLNAEGLINGVQILLEDFTEQKLIEEELLKASKIESIGILAGGIAHDFNNILTIILGNISLAKRYAHNEERIYLKLSEVERAAFQAKELTNQLLTFAKGGTPIMKTASIKQTIEETVNFATRGSNVNCKFDIPENLWPGEFDKGQISQVINNLIINAKHAMPKGGTINVSAENITVNDELRLLPLPKGKYVSLTIEDHGIGIPEDHLSRIFDPYFTTKQEGSGLGLATSYSIVKKHGGHISVQSELGKGTRFIIRLPASEQQIVQLEHHEIKDIEGKGNVLVMDDEELIREIVAEMLGKFGYEVACAKDGVETIDLYSQAQKSGRPFNVVIMDLTNPGGMGGVEAVKKLVEIDPRVKAIVSSGYSNDPVMADFRNYGFSGVISKPYTVEELTKVVYEVIRGYVPNLK